jgi:hypothetical protein
VSLVARRHDVDADGLFTWRTIGTPLPFIYSALLVIL